MAYAFRRENKGTPSFTGVYEGPDGSRRSAGTFPSRRAALRAAQREEQAVREGRWWDRSLGDIITFETYVENSWLPSKHLEATTRAAYRSYLDRHFLPFFGSRPMARILPSLVQEWVTKATAEGLSPRSVRKYHVMLHSIFERAVRDQLILMNPCEHTELPKIIVRRTRTLTPDEFGRLIAAIPERHRLLVATAIETGMRWGELIALRPRHIDFLRRTVTVEETIVEVSKKHSGTGERMIIKPYPRDDESRTLVCGLRGWTRSLSTSGSMRLGVTNSCSAPRWELRSRVTPFEPECGCRLSKRRASTSVFGYMIFGTRTRRGFSLAARISRA
jgi:hypothetical protein